MDPQKFQVALISLIPLLLYVLSKVNEYRQTRRIENWDGLYFCSMWPYIFFNDLTGNALWSFSKPLFIVCAIANTVFACFVIVIWTTHYWRNRYPGIPDQVIKTECALLFVIAALICAFSITDTKMNPYISFTLLAAILISHFYSMKRYQVPRRPKDNPPSQGGVIEAEKLN